MRYIKNPFSVRRTNDDTIYYCFGYDREFCYLKKVNSANKYFKVYKLSAYHILLTKSLKNKLYKSIRECYKNNISTKESYYYDHHNILKNYNRLHKVYNKLLVNYESKKGLWRVRKIVLY